MFDAPLLRIMSSEKEVWVFENSSEALDCSSQTSLGLADHTPVHRQRHEICCGDSKLPQKKNLQVLAGGLPRDSGGPTRVLAASVDNRGNRDSPHIPVAFFLWFGPQSGCVPSRTTFRVSMSVGVFAA
jgi:hypothetical protein